MVEETNAPPERLYRLDVSLLEWRKLFAESKPESGTPYGATKQSPEEPSHRRGLSGLLATDAHHRHLHRSALPESSKVSGNSLGENAKLRHADSLQKSRYDATCWR
jgi:hypothetical protein